MLGFLKKWIKTPEKSVMEERRKGHRYDVPSNYPLVVKSGNETIELVDISLSGMKVACSETHDIDDELDIKVCLEEDSVEVNGKVVYKHEDDALGLYLNYSDSYLNYYYLIAPLVIGSSLKEYPRERVNQNDPSYLKRVFFGGLSSCLTLWCNKEDENDFHLFELELEKFIVRGEKGALKFFNVKDEADTVRKTHKSSVLVNIDDNEFSDSTKFFRWILLNFDYPVVKEKLNAYLDNSSSQKVG